MSGSLKITRSGWTCLTLVVALFLAGLVLAETEPVAPTDDGQAELPTGWQGLNHDELLPADDEPLVSAAGNLRIITAGQIRRSGATTAAEALAYLSDLHLTLDSSGRRRFRVRGLDQEDVQVFLDGVPLSSGYDHHPDLDAIPTAAIRHIIVVLGGGSVLYGSGGQAATINVVTRRGAEKFHLDADGRFSDGGEPRLGLTASGRTASLGYLLSASFLQTTGYHLSESFESKRNEDGGKRNNSDQRMMRFLGKFDYTPIQQTTLYAAFDVQNGAYGVPPEVRGNEPLRQRYESWQRWNLNLGDTIRIADRISLGFRFFRTDLVTILDVFDDGFYRTQENEGSFGKVREDDAWGFNQTGAFDLGRFNNLRYSLWYERDTHRDRLRHLEYWNKFVTDLLSAGVEDEIIPLEGLAFILGGSFAVQVPQYASGINQGRNRVAGNGSAQVVYRPIEMTRLRASASYRTRFPSQQQLYATVEDVVGDYDLSAQSFLMYEGGVDQAILTYADLELTGFFIEGRDLIRPKRQDDDTLLYQNGGSANYAGATLAANVHPWQWVFWRTGYTFLLAENTTAGEDKNVAYRPAHKLFTHLGLTSPFGTSGDVLFTFVSEQDYPDPTDGDFQTLGEYATLDLRLAQKIVKHFELYGSIDNVLDYDYESEYGLPHRGRTLWLGLRIDLDLQEGYGAP